MGDTIPMDLKPMEGPVQDLVTRVAQQPFITTTVLGMDWGYLAGRLPASIAK